MKKSKMKVKFLEPTTSNRNQMCPFDFCRIYEAKELRVYDKGTTKFVKTYVCPVCNKKYIHEKKFPDMQIIGIGSQDYYNLNLSKKQRRVKLSFHQGKKISMPSNNKSASGSTIAAANKEKAHGPKAAPKATIKVYPTTVAKEFPAPAANAAPASTDFTIQSPVTKNLPHVITKETAEGYVVFTKMKLVDRCVHPNCYSILDEIKIQFKSKKGKTLKMAAKKCAACNQYYVPYGTYNANRDMMKCLNEKAVLEYENRLKEQQELAKMLYEQKVQQSRELKSQMAKTEPPKEADRKKQPVQQLTPAEKRAVNEFDRIRKEALKVSSSDNYSEIQLKDFVIKKNTFHCIHNEHALKDISASITIINQKGNFEIMKVPAGYCKDCNVYFIFEDVYKRILSRGTPICRMYDWKTIENGSNVGNMMLAPESLLRQYGYNVNANEGLSSERRKRILQILVDNQIMTKSEIISYLKFFISQRKNNSSMKMAVEKWNSDKAFIENYKIGSLQNYYVRSLKKK